MTSGASSCTIAPRSIAHKRSLSSVCFSFIVSRVTTHVLLEHSRHTCICILDILFFAPSENYVLEESTEFNFLCECIYFNEPPLVCKRQCNGMQDSSDIHMAAVSSMYIVNSRAQCFLSQVPRFTFDYLI